MKVIYLILILILFTSCSYSIEPVKNADSITTVEMVREIEKDTTTYKILKTDNKIYLVNKDTNKIESRIKNKPKDIILVKIGVCILIAIFCFILGNTLFKQ